MRWPRFGRHCAARGPRGGTAAPLSDRFGFTLRDEANPHPRFAFRRFWASGFENRPSVTVLCSGPARIPGLEDSEPNHTMIPMSLRSAAVVRLGGCGLA